MEAILVCHLQHSPQSHLSPGPEAECLRLHKLVPRNISERAELIGINAKLRRDVVDLDDNQRDVEERQENGDDRGGDGKQASCVGCRQLHVASEEKLRLWEVPMGAALYGPEQRSSG